MLINRVKGCPPWMNQFIGAKKKIGWDTGRFGLFRFGVYEFGAENEIGLDAFGVYQQRMTKKGYRTVKMRFQITREEVRTDNRKANWAKYVEALHGWRDLTAEQKELYNTRVKGLPMNGRNLYVKEYMLSH
jgi:hypothetical protein